MFAILIPNCTFDLSSTSLSIINYFSNTRARVSANSCNACLTIINFVKFVTKLQDGYFELHHEITGYNCSSITIAIYFCLERSDASSVGYQRRIDHG